MAKEKLQSDPAASTDVADESVGDPVSTGMLHLESIEGSIDRRSLDYEIELTRTDGVLVLGDVRRCAEKATASDEHEIAHRIWTVLAEAALRVDNEPLLTRALAMADGALVQARDNSDLAKSIDTSRVNDPGPGQRPTSSSRGVSYDYDRLAADRAAGFSQAETARRHDCSPGTVARAVRYVAIRDALLDESPSVLDDIRQGLPVAELAAKYKTEPKVMRWVVSDFWDRRASGRS